MTANLMAQNGYAMAGAPVRTPRSIEIEVIAKITRKLHSVGQNEPERIVSKAQALYENRKLWGIFAADVALQDNPLPRELKANILYLAEFVNVQTSKVLASGAPIEPLIEVNQAIMRGLRGEAV